MKLAVYTDGGCHRNPGVGGWAYVVVYRGKIIAERYGGEENTTNNRMELSAVSMAFEVLPDLIAPLDDASLEIAVYTDSQYVQKGISEWIIKWKRNGWRNSDKQPVKNKDLWLKLDALVAPLIARVPKHSLKWEWIKGHAGNRYNERCDKMTQKAISELSSD
jgi:ribonuclease HI